jgi:uncharacterized Tic20 family protein
MSTKEDQELAAKQEQKMKDKAAKQEQKEEEKFKATGQFITYFFTFAAFFVVAVLGYTLKNDDHQLLPAFNKQLVDYDKQKTLFLVLAVLLSILEGTFAGGITYGLGTSVTYLLS